MATPAPVTPPAAPAAACTPSPADNIAASNSASPSPTNFSTAKEKLERSLSGAIGAAIRSVSGDGGETAGGSSPEEQLAANKSSSAEIPLEQKSEPTMSVCGNSMRENAAGVVVEDGEEEATASYLFRVMFGSCTTGGGQTSTGAAGSSMKRSTSYSGLGGSVRRSASKKSLRHALIDEEEGDAAEEGAAAAGAEQVPAIDRRSRSRRSLSRGRTRDVVPPAQIEGVPSFSPKTPRKIMKSTPGEFNKGKLDEDRPTSTKNSTGEWIRQAHESPSSPYRVSEVPCPAPAESVDEADVLSYCFDDGISAISAHTLEEMARLDPSPPKRKSTRRDDPPLEEGFDITIHDPAINKTNRASNKASGSTPSKSSNHQLATSAASSRSSNNNARNSAATAKGNIKISTDAAAASSPAHQLTSTPREVLDASRNIRDVDESGDGVGALPLTSPRTFDRMCSTNTPTSRTTATSGSSFENTFLKDEAEFWEEEARREGGDSVDFTTGTRNGADVDENGFPITSPLPVTPTKLSRKDLALVRKKLSDRTRSSDLTAPTAAMTMMTPQTMNESAMDLSSLPSSRHPHDTIPLDLSSSPMVSPSMDRTALVGGDKRRKSRKQRIHDSFVRKGKVMMMKGGGYAVHEEMASQPAHEIYITNDHVEVGEI